MNSRLADVKFRLGRKKSGALRFVWSIRKAIYAKPSGLRFFTSSIVPCKYPFSNFLYSLKIPIVFSGMLPCSQWWSWWDHCVLWWIVNEYDVDSRFQQLMAPAGKVEFGVTRKQHQISAPQVLSKLVSRWENASRHTSPNWRFRFICFLLLCGLVISFPFYDTCCRLCFIEPSQGFTFFWICSESGYKELLWTRQVDSTFTWQSMEGEDRTTHDWTFQQSFTIHIT